ncbi:MULTISPECIES: DUF4142 domain-containing protein [unclassified Sinorhizobium]|uniref:DUF4142 domain-containing protein n=1 Tax=unclassified Sinorhizobium TaxID=2613772 RepID=UPI0035235FFD
MRLIPALVLALAAAAWTFVGPLPARAQQVPQPQEFADVAAFSSGFEVEAAQLALMKAQNADIKAFAEDMARDHGKVTERLAEAAKQEGITLPSAMDGDFRRKMDALKAAPPEEFDRFYLSTQATVHSDAIALFELYSQKGPDGALKKFAAETLPTLRMHQMRIEQLRSRQG